MPPIINNTDINFISLKRNFTEFGNLLFPSEEADIVQAATRQKITQSIAVPPIVNQPEENQLKVVQIKDLDFISKTFVIQDIVIQYQKLSQAIQEASRSKTKRKPTIGSLNFLTLFPENLTIKQEGEKIRTYFEKLNARRILTDSEKDLLEKYGLPRENQPKVKHDLRALSLIFKDILPQEQFSKEELDIIKNNKPVMVAYDLIATYRQPGRIRTFYEEVLGR